MSLTDRETESRRKLEELASKLAAAAAQAGYASGIQLAVAGSGDNRESGASRTPESKAGGLTAASNGSQSEERAANATGQGLKSLTGTLTTIAKLNPIVAGLLRILGGGSSDETAARLTRIERPAAASYQWGVSEQTGWGMGEIDYSASGLPRQVNGGMPGQVVVQVQAMDSRSFLDHRDEIASAVRQALLESHGLGDVMREV